MYARCLSCDRSLGTNAELPHLPVGRRIAFDSANGRLWVVCRRCDQWNLVPFEERWEALEDCRRVASDAEARGGGKSIGFSRTAKGLELLRADGQDDIDIANWRYGRRFRRRQSVLWWIAAMFAVLTVGLGTRAAAAAESSFVGVYLGVIAAAWLANAWWRSPKLWLRAGNRLLGRTTIWPWRIPELRLERARGGTRPVLVIPGGLSQMRLEGDEAAAFLATLLPQINGTDCAAVSIRRVIGRVSTAEKQANRRNREDARPWEIIASKLTGQSLVSASPEERLALEMAVTEELDHADLASRADRVEGDWDEEEEIADIADDLLLPPEIESRVAEEKRKRGRRG